MASDKHSDWEERDVWVGWIGGTEHDGTLGTGTSAPMGESEFVGPGLSAGLYTVTRPFVVT